MVVVGVVVLAFLLVFVLVVLAEAVAVATVAAAVVENVTSADPTAYRAVPSAGHFAAASSCPRPARPREIWHG